MCIIHEKKVNHVYNSEHLVVSRCPGKGAHNFWTGDQASTRCWERAGTAQCAHCTPAEKGYNSNLGQICADGKYMLV